MKSQQATMNYRTAVKNIVDRVEPLQVSTNGLVFVPADVFALVLTSLQWPLFTTMACKHRHISGRRYSPTEK